MPWLVWAYFVHCRKTHQRNWRAESAWFFGTKYHRLIVKRTSEARIIGYPDRHTCCLCDNAWLVRKFRLPDRPVLVDIRFVGNYDDCHCFMHSSFQSSKGGISQPDEKLENGIETISLPAIGHLVGLIQFHRVK
jgi:hypothetical protein